MADDDSVVTNDDEDELTEEDLTLAGKSTLGEEPNETEEDENDEGLSSGDEHLTLVTREGLKKLQDELTELENVRRSEVAQRLKEAISFGDLSENSEYEDAKNEQALLETRILELQEMIKTAKIISEKKGKGKFVKIGSTVTIENLTDKEGPETFMIVGSTEADPTAKKISNESPLGSALIDKEEGDEIEIEAPAGMFRYKILKVK
jgi:transcription elongation factor GreA